MLKVKLVFESSEGTITCEPAGMGQSTEVLADGKTTVAAPNWQRLAQIAACVVSCIASTARESANAVAAEKGGAHQTPATKA